MLPQLICLLALLSPTADALESSLRPRPRPVELTTTQKYGDYFPTQKWKRHSLEDAGFDRQKFQRVLDYVWEEKGNHFSDAFVVRWLYCL